MKVPISVLQAAVGLALEHGRIERDPARRNSTEWAESVEKRRAFAQYVHERGYDARFISNYTARIPQEAYGPGVPETPFVMERPPDHLIRTITTPDDKPSGGEVIQMPLQPELPQEVPMPMGETG